MTFCALLEAVGVESAFVTVPGHIYAAFKLDMEEAQARSTLSRFQDLIIRDDDTVWVPVETTLLTADFLRAWAVGARQWREHDNTGRASLLPTRRAWSTYEPVAFGVSDYQIELPARERTEANFTGQLDRLISQEIASQETRILARLESQPDNVRIRNGLGVLYARYGRTEQARDQFEMATSGERPYAPALLNLGNLEFLNQNVGEAKRQYLRALYADPENSAALLGLARCEHEMESYDAAKDAYERLAVLSPSLAERYSYLGDPDASTGRASDVALIGNLVVWGEE